MEGESEGDFFGLYQHRAELQSRQSSVVYSRLSAVSREGSAPTHYETAPSVPRGKSYCVMQCTKSLYKVTNKKVKLLVNLCCYGWDFGFPVCFFFLCQMIFHNSYGNCMSHIFNLIASWFSLFMFWLSQPLFRQSWTELRSFWWALCQWRVQPKNLVIIRRNSLCLDSKFLSMKSLHIKHSI